MLLNRDLDYGPRFGLNNIIFHKFGGYSLLLPTFYTPTIEYNDIVCVCVLTYIVKKGQFMSITPFLNMMDMTRG